VPTGKTAIHDDLILSVAETVENLSRQCARWHYIFRETYFSDPSFLLTSLFFGVNDAVSLKYNVLSDILKKKNRESLYDILDKIHDIFQGIQGGVYEQKGNSSIFSVYYNYITELDGLYFFAGTFGTLQ
jgi:hypothetical protein